MKYFIVSRYFDLNSPNRAPERSDYGAYPELKNLNLSAEQTRARAKAIAKLEEYINDDTKFSRGKGEAGWTSFAKHLMTLDSTREEIQQQMDDLRKMLLTEKSPNWDGIVETHLNTINPDGTANLEMTDTKMSWRRFLQKIVGASEAAKILYVAVPTQSVENKEQQDELVRQKTRLETFLLSLEAEKEGLFSAMWKARTGQDGIQRQILYTRKLLQENDIKGALDFARKSFNGKWNGVDIDAVVGTDNGLMRAQRAMKDTAAASMTAMNTAKDTLVDKEGNLDQKSNTQLNRLKQEITTEKLQEAKGYYASKAETMFNSAIDSLPVNDPDRLDMIKNKAFYMDNLQIGLALETKIGDFIKNNGSDGLGDILEQYNDMKGLYGAFNLKDENVRLLKEIVVIVGSMVATMGASAVLAAAATAARVGVAANAGRAAKVAHA